MDNSFTPYLEQSSTTTPLSKAEMQSAFQLIFTGKVKEEEIITFLTNLSKRGETIDEITGAVMALRSFAKTIKAPANTMDCCGTGGDGAHTYNISTAVAFVTAACGIPIAKHGNRASSSKCGAADVLETLGINLDVSHERLEQALHELNFCFLMAPNHHQAMKHVAGARKKIGQRTIFNLLGPLVNPAQTTHQLIGVYDKKWLEPLAHVLNNLGTKNAWLVHGHDGLDEITTTAPTTITMLKNGNISNKIVTPDDFGLNTASPQSLKGGSARQNAQALLDILQHREQNAYRDIVLANSAAILNINDKAQSLTQGVDIAAHAIDSGNAYNILNRYIDFTNQ